MKCPFQKCIRAGFTLIELLVLLAVVMILSMLIFPGGSGSRQRAARITCVNNLKQVNLSFRLYSADNRDRYPMNISTNDSPLADEATPVYHYLKLAADLLGTPKVVICPEDKKRKVANDFVAFGNTNVSYFIGLEGDEPFPNSIVAGDHNVTNGFPPRQGILELTTNQTVGFTKEIHKMQGNIALGDGSVQQVSSARLRSEIIRNSPFATNRIKLP